MGCGCDEPAAADNADCAGNCLAGYVDIEGSCVTIVEGCTDTESCNYNANANTEDGSCYNNDLGCGCDEPAAEFGYDCSGNCLSDTDDDGVCDEFDNCPNDFNPLQEDIDSDGTGDDCDSVGINERYSDFLIFPNPANDIVNIQFKNTIENVEIKLFNSLGKLVQTVYSGSISNNQNISLETNNLSSGVYVIHSMSDNEIVKKTFTINKN